jgi:mannose-6-phosphate isomerase-like protein (cupin superfamily)
MNTPKIQHNSEASEYFFDEGCFINEWWNRPEDAALSIARARVAPGETTHWHCLHNSVERYVILSGEGVVEVGELAPTIVKPGDVVVIPADVRQRIHNSGSEDLVFLALCTPRFQAENYVDLEDEREGDLAENA